MVTSLITIADEFESLVQRFNSIDSLSQETREISVDHARDILEKLRFTSEDEEGDEQRFDLDDIKQKLADTLLKAAKAFLGAVAEIVKGDPKKLVREEISPIFEKTFDALGKVSYRVRMDVINLLIKQGKSGEAASMRARLEAQTPAKFKTSEAQVPLAQLVRIIEAGLTSAELIEKRVAAGLQLPQWQNLPPAPPPQKKPVLKEGAAVKAKALAALFTGDHTVLASQVAGVSEAALIPAAQKINELPDPLVHHGIGYKVSAVSKEELVHPAKKVNEESEQQLDPTANLKR